ncbi:MAG: hypothetical protein GY844_19845 [Bradyrhizobium sp.]|nr:hypothetical protein [Bradyrhizobium sp.]
MMLDDAYHRLKAFTLDRMKRREQPSTPMTWSQGPYVWILNLLWWGFGYGTARVILPVVSFGKVHVESLSDWDNEFNWLSCRRIGDGQIEVESTVAGWIGLLIYFICLAVFLHFI